MTDGPASTLPAPNYAARRMLVSAGVLTALVVTASVVWRAVRGDDDGPATANAAWDAIALVTTTSGDVTLVDATGSIVGRQSGGHRVTDVHVAGSHLALVGERAITLLDVATGSDVQPATVELAPRSRFVTRAATVRERLLLTAGDREGGPIQVIDGDSGETLDIAELADLAGALFFPDNVRVDSTGTSVAVADAASFQTIVVRGIGGAGSPTVENYPDVPLAVSDRLLATTQVVGGRSDVSVHVAGDPASTPVTTGIVAGAAIVDGMLVAVTTEGSVIGVRPGDRRVRQLATLELPAADAVTAVHVAAGGTRLVVYGSSYVAVLTTRGEVVYATELGDPDAGQASAATTAPGSLTATTPASTAQTNTAPVSTGPASTGPASTGPVSTGPVSTGPVSTGPASTGPASTGPSSPPPAVSTASSAPLIPAWEWACLPVAAGTAAAAIVDLTDGAERAALRGVAVAATSADGCTVLGTRGETTVVIAEDGTAALGPTRAAALSPDGRYVVRRLAAGPTELVPISATMDVGEPIDISAAVTSPAVTVAFVDR